ncbi:single-stranded-DNA-specific exonuclease RecJ [Alkalihalobacillus pseudalcaliphilus]|uniref:single-stranded-DNA-specific exonuclease RecJ n=1 Tax=Alkalihalobacillus pseudalcaliphilus TaxID=79884 RepID=UPI00064DC0DA|nr:single-stranded-DNA-specific exonuclease RecJ [Alkalihalobacillus pseudalcaliphilus]KMK75722.1 recombinase RecJ [Alkalihalobacillus pseudalcaliphilus]
MLNSKARWKVQDQEQAMVDLLVTELQVAPLVAKLLINRGLTTPEIASTFLNKNQIHYHDPYAMHGMKETVDRIQLAVEKKEKILIFGDYDADGVSSTSVMIYTLQMLGAQFDYYIPNRFTEGYGPNEPALRWAKEEGFSLVVTVDTGISAVHEAKVAKDIGLDFIVTDHHEAPPVLPDAYAIVNPKQPGCSYPFKGLAGVGVAFKVSQALLGRVPKELLDIVVIGTIADLVPLVDENRLLAMEGLHALQSTSKPGLIAIKKIAGIDKEMLEADHVGFAIGPRMNAAGRLGSANPAVELLTTDKSEDAGFLAEEIDQLNKERQQIVSTIAKEAVELVETQYPPDEHAVLVIAKEDWNAGVIGIVASRLVEKFYRPTIVLSIDHEKGVAKGSARSIEGFDMFAELSKSRDILPHFGGHPMAAGLTISLEHLDELRDRLQKQASEVLSEDDFIPVKQIDLVASVDEISLDIIKQMKSLAPFGVSNPTPKIMLEKAHISEMKKIGSESNHLKLQFNQNGTSLDGIGFHFGYAYDQISVQDQVSAVGTLSINEWNGHIKPQLMIEDIAVTEWQLFDWRSVQMNYLHKKLLQITVPHQYLVAFQEDTQVKLGLESEKVWSFDQLKEEAISFEQAAVILLDLPISEQDLTHLFAEKGQPSQLYCLFYQEGDSFFSMSPNRESFKWFYAFLRKQKQFSLQQQGMKLVKYKGWTKDTISFMVQVFVELGFIRYENGWITVEENPEKKSLSDSITFQKQEQQRKLENDFVYSSFEHLKYWFSQVFEKDQRESTIKETV